jgi:hypothetical protein
MSGRGLEEGPAGQGQGWVKTCRPPAAAAPPPSATPVPARRAPSRDAQCSRACREAHTTWTAVAPDAVFTVRTRATGHLFGPSIARKFAHENYGTIRSAGRALCKKNPALRSEPGSCFWSVTRCDRRVVVFCDRRAPRLQTSCHCRDARGWMKLEGRRSLTSRAFSTSPLCYRLTLEPARLLPRVAAASASDRILIL